MLDPYGLHLKWDVLKKASEMRTIEIFFNFSIMDANMNVLWRNPEKVSQTQIERMDVFLATILGERLVIKSKLDFLAISKKSLLMWLS